MDFEIKGEEMEKNFNKFHMRTMFEPSEVKFLFKRFRLNF